MAFRLRRDAQKASYYVWFLGAKEVKSLRDQRIIENTLAYLMEKSQLQEPIKVTLQLSRKGIKIIQGSFENNIPSSAITNSIQWDDIVACVLLLYNPVTKCPIHIHAYRCDSENTALTLHQQIQTLINRPENIKRLQELESRVGVMNEMMGELNVKSSSCLEAKSQTAQNESMPAFQRQTQLSKCHNSSSKGSDTGNSTRDSECSEENCTGSLKSRSPSNMKRLTNQSHHRNELFDSLAAELRAKLNGNGPPLLLPPRDYDTVHRSKGNLAAIELRRCRNSLIVGANSTQKANNLPKTVANNVKKHVSSIGSSGIGSDSAPSPERHETISSSDDENWVSENDKSTSALKIFQLDVESSNSALPDSQQFTRTRNNIQHSPREEYLRNLSANSQATSSNMNKCEESLRSQSDFKMTKAGRDCWSGEKEIKPIIMRPIDYNAKVNTILQDEQSTTAYKSNVKEKAKIMENFGKTETPHKFTQHQMKSKLMSRSNDYDSTKSQDDGASHDSLHVINELNEHRQFGEVKGLHQKPLSSPSIHYLDEEIEKYDESDVFTESASVPIERTDCRSKYMDAKKRNNFLNQTTVDMSKQMLNRRNHGEHYSHQRDRNPYSEPESLPYIESMEKMMKSPIMRFKSFEPNAAIPNHISIKKTLQNQWSRENSHHDEDFDFLYKETGGSISSKEVLPCQTINDARKSSNNTLSWCESEIPSTMAELKARTPRQKKLWVDRNPTEFLDNHSAYSSEERKTSSKSIKETQSCLSNQNHSRDLHKSKSPDAKHNLEKVQHYRNRFESAIFGKSLPPNKQDNPVKDRMHHLPKGYRHSYAEPMYMRDTNRVGLAAVNPY